MEPMIPNSSQAEVQRISLLREKGYSYRQIGQMVGRGASTVARYYRIFDRYGYAAFPEASKDRRSQNVSQNARIFGDAPHALREAGQSQRGNRNG